MIGSRGEKKTHFKISHIYGERDWEYLGVTFNVF